MHRTTQALRLMMVMVCHHFIEKFSGFEAMAVDMLTTTGPVAGATLAGNCAQEHTTALPLTVRNSWLRSICLYIQRIW